MKLARYAPAYEADTRTELDNLPAARVAVTVELDPGAELHLEDWHRDRDGRKVFRYALSRVKYRARRWILEIADHLRASKLPHAERRADSMSECTRYSRVPVCLCGTPAPGKLGTEHIRCHSRSCPRCGPHRAEEYRGRIRKWFESGGAPEGTWWHLVFTSQYDPWDSRSLEPAAIRSRVDSCRRLWRSWWRRHKGLAALVGVEIGRWGEVHLHIMYCTKGGRPAPNEPERWVGSQPIDNPAHNVGEIVKYTAKVPAKKASWWATPAVVPHPKLIANWEIATWGARLIERYGAARSLPEVELEPDDIQEGECANPQCRRSMRDAKIREIPTRIWVGWAKHKGIAPFHHRRE